jgi:hypothetical protein
MRHGPLARARHRATQSDSDSELGALSWRVMPGTCPPHHARRDVRRAGIMIKATGRHHDGRPGQARRPLWHWHELALALEQQASLSASTAYSRSLSASRVFVFGGVRSVISEDLNVVSPSTAGRRIL